MYLLAQKIRWNIGDKGKSGPSAKKKNADKRRCKVFYIE